MPKLCGAETFRIKYSFPYYCRLHRTALLYYLHMYDYIVPIYLYIRGDLRLSRSDRLDRRMTAEVTIFSGSTRVVLYYIILYVKNIIVITTDTAWEQQQRRRVFAEHNNISRDPLRQLRTRTILLRRVLYYDNNTGTYNILYIIGVILLPSNQL